MCVHVDSGGGQWYCRQLGDAVMGADFLCAQVQGTCIRCVFF